MFGHREPKCSVREKIEGFGSPSPVRITSAGLREPLRRRLRDGNNRNMIRLLVAKLDNLCSSLLRTRKLILEIFNAAYILSVLTPKTQIA